MPAAQTALPESLKRRPLNREPHKHDRLCVSVSGLRYCWCMCPQCWRRDSSKCVCSRCRCRSNGMLFRAGLRAVLYPD